jgi:hypothetical protein
MSRKFFMISILLILALAVSVTSANAGSPMGTAFTFQGKIRSTYTGYCDMTFSLWDASSAGSQVGSSITRNRVQVAAGAFTQVLDFGPGAINGDARWVEVRARCPSSLVGLFLNYGRTKLEAVPYALVALNATSALDADLLDGSHGAYYLNASNINAGTLGSSFFDAYQELLDAGYLNGANGDIAMNNNSLQNSLNADMLDNYHMGNGFMQIPFSNGTWNNNLNADLLDGKHASDVLLVGGNAPAGALVLGTTNSQAVEVIVNGVRALRMESNGYAANMIGGESTNWVLAGVSGATIGGGGGTNYANRVTDQLGTVCGGYSNMAGNNSGTNSDAQGATVAGGWYNAAGGSYSMVPGGWNNLAMGQYSFAAGRNAKAYMNGTFVWADSTAADFSSSIANQFAVRANGGVVFSTTSNLFTINGNTVWHAGNDFRNGCRHAGWGACQQLHPADPAEHHQQQHGRQRHAALRGLGLERLLQRAGTHVGRNGMGLPVAWCNSLASGREHQRCGGLPGHAG